MIAAICILTTISVIAELMLFFKFKFVQNMIHRHEVLGLALSFGLTIGLGTIFGAQGLIAMTAGLLSTVITQPFYFCWSRYKRSQEKRSLKITQAVLAA